MTQYRTALNACGFISSLHSPGWLCVPGPPTAPPDGHRPVIRASRDNGEVITVDLVQVRRLRRMVVYAYSASGQPVQWGGTLTLEMLPGTRPQLPLARLDGPPGASPVPLPRCTCA